MGLNTVLCHNVKKVQVGELYELEGGVLVRHMWITHDSGHVLELTLFGAEAADTRPVNVPAKFLSGLSQIVV